MKSAVVDLAAVARQKLAGSPTRYRVFFAIGALIVIAWMVWDIHINTSLRTRHPVEDAPPADFPALRSNVVANGEDNNGVVESEGGGDLQQLRQLLGKLKLNLVADAIGGWQQRLQQFQDVTMVFFAGLEGTGHHFWNEFLTDHCSTATNCMHFSEKIFKEARGLFKKCAPKSSTQHETIQSTKLLTINNHCYAREAVQKTLIKVTDHMVKEISATQARNQKIIFVNTLGTGQMWSYPNGKTFNNGRGNGF